MTVFPRPAVWAYWIQAEIIAMATDLAEFVGAAIGFKMLLGVSLLQGAILTGIATFLILMLQQRGQKPMEVVIGGLLVFVAAAAYIAELFFFPSPMSPNWAKACCFPPCPMPTRIPGGRRTGGDHYAPCHLSALLPHAERLERHARAHAIHPPNWMWLSP